MKHRSDQSPLPGLAVLVVEDEALVAMNLESMLEDLGCKVIGPAMRLDRARQLLQQESSRPDAAILDVNIAGEKVFAVAEQLADMNVPFVFATGYGQTGVPPQFCDRPILQKPYSSGDIARALRSALGLDQPRSR